MRKLLNHIEIGPMSIIGLFQGFFGGFFGGLGIAFAFPGTSPDSKDYEDDMVMVPFGYIMLLIWIAVMAFIIVKVRKNKAELIEFIISWGIGLIGVCALFLFG